MVKMSVRQYNISDLSTLDIARRHRQASGIERHAIVDHKTRQMLSRRCKAVLLECAWKKLKSHCFVLSAVGRNAFNVHDSDDSRHIIWHTFVRARRRSRMSRR